MDDFIYGEGDEEQDDDYDPNQDENQAETGDEGVVSQPKPDKGKFLQREPLRGAA